jgi:AGCS family alanine or glycine:cation symporter
MPYRYAFLALLFVGALLQGKYLEIVWAVGDTFNALMALPNLIGLLLLVGYVARFSNDYFKDRDGTLRRLDAGHYELRERR